MSCELIKVEFVVLAFILLVSIVPLECVVVNKFNIFPEELIKSIESDV